MYCFDTSVIIHLFDGTERIKKKVEALNQHNISLTPVGLCELYKGAVHSKVTERRLTYIDSLLQELTLLDFNEQACRIFGHSYLALKRAGKPIKDADLMIAAICKAHNQVLITTDAKHFNHIPDLKVEVW